MSNGPYREATAPELGALLATHRVPPARARSMARWSVLPVILALAGAWATALMAGAREVCAATVLAVFTLAFLGWTANALRRAWAAAHYAIERREGGLVLTQRRSRTELRWSDVAEIDFEGGLVLEITDRAGRQYWLELDFEASTALTAALVRACGLGASQGERVRAGEVVTVDGIRIAADEISWGHAQSEIEGVALREPGAIHVSDVERFDLFPEDAIVEARWRAPANEPAVVGPVATDAWKEFLGTLVALWPERFGLENPDSNRPT